MTLYAFNGKRPGLGESVFVAPSARIIGAVRIGRESSVWFNTVIRGDMDAITIGQNTNLQDLCVCHTDRGIPLVIGDRVTVGHGCVIHGCTIEDDCLIGMGAIVMNRSVIGKGSVVAAGSVVLEGTVVPPFSLVAGTPAAVKKSLEGDDRAAQGIRAAAGIYTANARDFGSSDLFYPIDEQG